MKHTITIALFLLGVTAIGQDTVYVNTYYDKEKLETVYDTVNPTESYEKFIITQTFNDDSINTQVFLATKIKIFESNYIISNDEEIRSGKQFIWYSTGQLNCESNYLKDKLHGSLKTFYESGEKKRLDFFDNGKFISGTVWNTDGNVIPHYPYERFPEFNGGEAAMYQWLGQNLIYPKEAKDKNIQGRVYIYFVVEQDGSISNAHILESPNDLLSEEALRVVNAMPKWLPGYQRGKLVRAKFNLPIVFQLSGGRKSKKKKKK